VKLQVPPFAARVAPKVQVLEVIVIGEDTPKRSDVRFTDFDPEFVTVKDCDTVS
jgi:hypothetical protein